VAVSYTTSMDVAAWPATFLCEHCGARLRLDRTRAIRVGRDKRILASLA